MALLSHSQRQALERADRETAQRREAESAEQKQRQRFETTLASIGDAVISTDAEGRIMFANKIAQSLVGWPEAEIHGKRLDEIFRIINEFTRAKVESPVAKVLREGTIVGLANHTLLIAKDGAEIPIDDSGAPIRGEDGAIQGTVLVFRDITPRRRAEAASRLLASIVESSNDAIISEDLDGVITSWNDGAARIFGYSAEEMIGRSISIISSPDRQDEVTALLERVKKGERIEQYETIRCTKSGGLVNVSLTVSPVRDAAARFVGASKIARDVTQQVRAAEHLARVNAELRQSNENLARSNEDLERFAFIASHDLQEPLRMITTYAQLLVREYPGRVEGNVAAYVGAIVESTNRMRELLADLLTYTALRGRPEEPVETVDLNQVIETVKENLKVAIDDSGAAVTSDQLPAVRAHRAHFVPLFFKT